eukprot:5542205-Amphidinium_carterae.1
MEFVHGEILRCSIDMMWIEFSRCRSSIWGSVWASCYLSLTRVTPSKSGDLSALLMAGGVGFCCSK